MTATAQLGQHGPTPLAPGLLLGIGLGGFVDGIVLHQILQWHHMLTATDRYPSSTVVGLEANTFADGLFHVATFVIVLVGTLVTTKAWQQGRLAPPWRVHIGLLLIGWGGFNLVEGLVDHHLLRIHHVRDDVSSTAAVGLRVPGRQRHPRPRRPRPVPPSVRPQTALDAIGSWRGGGQLS